MTAELVPDGRWPVNGQLPPPQITTARWRNRERRPGKWGKVIAHKRPFDSFAYGTDTESTWPARATRGEGPLQKAIVCSPSSGLIAVDVDRLEGYTEPVFPACQGHDVHGKLIDIPQRGGEYVPGFNDTRTAKLIGREQALTTRGDGFHILLDCRAIPPEDWPVQIPIAGADIKSNGYIPWPGSEHYSGERYELTDFGRHVIATPEIIAAIHADQADMAVERERRRAEGGNGSAGGDGSGHDGEVAATVLANALRGLSKDECYEQWLEVAIPRDPSWPYERDDFERHYGTAARKAEQIRAGEPQVDETEMAALAEMQAHDAEADLAHSAQAAAAAREKLHEHIRGWLGERELSRADFAGAVCCTANGSGEPLWGMMLDASSGGKTEVVRMATGVRNAALDEFTSASLLSFSKSSKPKPVGVLMRIGIGCNALITIADFSTILASSDRGLRDQLFADLRRVYDGELNRDLGNMANALHWHGRVTMLAASTPVIDEYSSHSDALGPRWLYHRGVPSTTKARREGAGKRLSERELGNRRTTARELFTEMVTCGQRAYPHIVLSEEAEEELGSIATCAATLRSPVPRDGYGRREITGLPVTEEPYRLAHQVKSLARGAMALGYSETEAVALARRCAIDTVPPVRARVLSALVDGRQRTAAAIGLMTGTDRKVARRALEDLRALQITSCPAEDDSDFDDVSGPAYDKDGNPIVKKWMLSWYGSSEDARERVKLVYEVMGALYTKPGQWSA